MQSVHAVGSNGIAMIQIVNEANFQGGAVPGGRLLAISAPASSPRARLSGSYQRPI